MGGIAGKEEWKTMLTVGRGEFDECIQIQSIFLDINTFPTAGGVIIICTNSIYIYIYIVYI